MSWRWPLTLCCYNFHVSIDQSKPLVHGQSLFLIKAWLRCAHLAGLCWLLPLAHAFAQSPPFVYEVQAAIGGLTSYRPAPGFGSGVAVADFDADGDADIFLPTAADSPNVLLRNNGDGSFDEVAAAYGLGDLRQARAALWLDYDSDGDLDLFLARDCFNGHGSCALPSLSLYEHTASGFIDISNQVGLNATIGSIAENWHSGGLSAGDISGDGLPDIYHARWQATAELYVSDGLLLRGDQAGYLLAGNQTGLGKAQAGHWQALLHDFDQDGQLDIFVNRDFVSNELWRNQQNLNFSNVAAAAGVDSAWNEMGLAASDYDNDGDIDIFVSNIHGWADPEQGRRNLLLRNDSSAGQILFTDQAESTGVADSDWGWGATWLDVDNNAEQDLAVTNGYCQPKPDYCGEEHRIDRTRMFQRNAGGTAAAVQFTEVGQQTGLDDTLLGATLVSADFNLDGRQDLLQTAMDEAGNGYLRLLINQPVTGAEPHHFITIRPRSGEHNSPIPGAVVRLVMLDGGEQNRLITAGTSWMGQEPAVAHFGLGNSTDIARIEIRWPDGGQISTWGAVPVDQVHVLCCRDMLIAESFE